MRRIGLTQRVEAVTAYNERRDCLDQAWATLLSSLGHLPVPLCNTITDVDNYLAELALDGVILTGGNDLGEAPERDHFETALLDFAVKTRLPVLGICRGMQIINRHFGGTLSEISNHVASRHGLMSLPVEGALFSIEPVEVNSYHRFGIFPDDLAPGLQALACHEDGSIEAVNHPELPITAVMWHPERESKLQSADQALFARFLYGSVHA